MIPSFFMWFHSFLISKRCLKLRPQLNNLHMRGRVFAIYVNIPILMERTERCLRIYNSCMIISTQDGNVKTHLSRLKKQSFRGTVIEYHLRFEVFFTGFQANRFQIVHLDHFFLCPVNATPQYPGYPVWTVFSIQ